MHRIYEAKAILDFGGGEDFLNLRSDIDESPAGGGTKSKFLTERLHFVGTDEMNSRTT